MATNDEVDDLRRKIRDLNTRCSFLTDVAQKCASEVKSGAQMAVCEYKKHIQDAALGGENANTELAVANLLEQKWKDYFTTPSSHIDSTPREVYSPTVPFALITDRIDKLTSRFAKHETLSTYIHLLFLRLFYTWGHFWVVVLCFLLRIDRKKVYELSKQRKGNE